MCAIVDANALGEVFGDGAADRAAAFFQWLDTGPGRLIVGGTQFRREVDKVTNASRWIQRAIRTGRATQSDDDDVDQEARNLQDLRDLRNRPIVRSDDPHVLALSRCSGARLLYTNDERLTQDFTNRRIVRNPPGKVYPTENYRDFLNDRRNRRLCGRR